MDYEAFGLRFTAEYKPGKDNIIADVLSRQHDDITLHSISLAKFAYYDDLRCQLKMHPSWTSKHTEWTAGTLSAGWTFVDGLLLFCRRIFVPADFSGVQKLFSVAHSVGHEGNTKTLHHLQASFSFPVGAVCFSSSFALVLLVRNTNPSSCIRQAYFNHYRYHIAFGLILAWTSSKVCPKLHTNRLF